MGIPGLMSYVIQRSETFSKKIELHDTKLVIDGNCIACQLYHSNKCNCCFGGDHGEYAYYVSEFFDELSKCNITPIIVFDGGLEDKKLNTILTRSKERLERISCSTPTNEQEIFPTLAKDVFKYIAQQKNIKIVQSLFEADDHIASIARILKCPVISNDSDFFIFDVKYIPVSSFKIGIFKSTSGYGYVKSCRVYTNEDFINNFPGMNKKTLPLAAALLGNDYICSSTFDNFFSFVNIPSGEKNKHYKIETVLKWLQNYTLDQALEIILGTLDPKKREETLETIEMVINGYLVPVTEMLAPLGYSPTEINKLTAAMDCEFFKFSQTQNSSLSKDQKTDSIYLTSCDNKTMIDKLSLNDNNILKPNVKSQVNTSIPAWFLKEYMRSKFPAYFMDMLHRQLLVTPELIEDHKHPACVMISLKLIKAIFKLLSNGTIDTKVLQYIARGKGANVATYELDCNDSNNQEFPTLNNPITLDINQRKQILISTLGVSDQLIIQFPPAWRLYIAIIKYWSVEAENHFTTKWHVYSLILMLVYHVVKKVIQQGSYFGKNSTVDNKNADLENKVPGQLALDMPIKKALENIQKTDCIKVEEFFKLYKSKDQKDFDIEIVHAFSLLQICLRYGMHFNVLLGYPYPDLNLAEFFSGTMLYNLYKDLKKYNRLNQRVMDIFSNSPSILQLFISTSTKIQNVIDK